MFNVGVYISGTEHNWKLKFSMQAHLTDINTIFEYCHNNNVDVLHLEDGTVYRPFLKNKTVIVTVFSQNSLVIFRICDNNSNNNNNNNNNNNKIRI